MKNTAIEHHTPHLLLSAHPGLRGQSITQVLPAELLVKVLDYLSPLGQTAVAQTCKAMANASDTSSAALVPTDVRTGRGGRMDWGKHFTTLPPNLRQVLRITARILPRPNIFSMDASIKTLHLELANAHERAGKGIVTFTHNSMVNALYRAGKAAKKAGIRMPDTTDIEKEGYTNAIPAQLSAARARASQGIVTGTHDSMVNALYYIKDFADKAGIPAPDVSAIEKEGYTKGMALKLNRARVLAKRGIVTGRYDSMVNAIYYAKQFAQKAGVPMPDTSEIEQEGLANASRSRF